MSTVTPSETTTVYSSPNEVVQSNNKSMQGSPSRANTTVVKPMENTVEAGGQKVTEQASKINLAALEFLADGWLISY